MSDGMKTQIQDTWLVKSKTKFVYYYAEVHARMISPQDKLHKLGIGKDKSQRTGWGFKIQMQTILKEQMAKMGRLTSWGQTKQEAMNLGCVPFHSVYNQHYQPTAQKMSAKGVFPLQDIY